MSKCYYVFHSGKNTTTSSVALSIKFLSTLQITSFFRLDTITNDLVSFMSSTPPDIVRLEHYDLLLYILGGIHNALCLTILLTYFLSYNISMPDSTGIRNFFRYVSQQIIGDKVTKII